MRWLSLYLDSYGGIPLGVTVIFFLKRTTDDQASELGVVFLRLFHLGRFHACWRLANVILI